MQKKRRNVRETGCVADLSGDFSNMKSRKGTIADICSLKSGRADKKRTAKNVGIVILISEMVGSGVGVRKAVPLQSLSSDLHLIFTL